MGLIKRVLFFLHYNSIDLRKSAPPSKPQICEVMWFNSGVIVNLGIELVTKSMFKP